MDDFDLMFELPPEFVTNFREEERPAYTEAVRRWGNPCLYVEEKSEGRGLEWYGGSLWFNEGERQDLTEFWRVFEKVRDEMRKVPA